MDFIKTQIEILYSNFFSNDDNIRKHSEDTIMDFISNIPTFSISLLSYCNLTTNLEFQKLSLIIIENIIHTNFEAILNNFNPFDISFQQFVKSTTDFSLQKLISHLIYLIGQHISWPFAQNSFLLYKEFPNLLPLSLFSFKAACKDQNISETLNELPKIVLLILTSTDNFQLIVIAIQIFGDFLIQPTLSRNMNEEIKQNILGQIYRYAILTKTSDVKNFTFFLDNFKEISR